MAHTVCSLWDISANTFYSLIREDEHARLGIVDRGMELSRVEDSAASRLSVQAEGPGVSSSS